MSTDRTTLDFSFVALVLSVTGRVRPDDLQAVPAIERASLLHAYADTYGASVPLHFEGDTLVTGAGEPLPVPPMPHVAAADAPSPAAATPTAPPSGGEAPIDPAAGATAVSPGPGVPDFFTDSAYTSAAAVPAVAGTFAVASPAAPAPMPGSAPSAGAMPLPATDGSFFGVPEPASSQPGAFGQTAVPALHDSAAVHTAADEATDMAQPKVSFLFWLLPVLLTWVGGLIAYFVVRPTNEKQAKTMLVTGIALTVAYALVGAAGFFGLGLLATSVVK